MGMREFKEKLSGTAFAVIIVVAFVGAVLLLTSPWW